MARLQADKLRLKGCRLGDSGLPSEAMPFRASLAVSRSEVALRATKLLAAWLRVGRPKSAYYYYASGAGESPKKKKDGERAALISDIFRDSNEIYGYRRIRAALERAGHVISEKVIRRLMKALNLKVKGKKARRYSSCNGETSLVPESLAQRDFLSWEAKREVACRHCRVPPP